MSSSHTRIGTIRNSFSLENLQDLALTLHEFERRGSYDAYDASTSWCMEKLCETGFSQVKRIAHRADGKNSALDCIMPEAWDLTGRSTLKIVSPNIPEYERMLADTDRNPLEVTTYSAPTPRGGITGEIIDYGTLSEFRPEFVKGKWIFITGHGSNMDGVRYRRLAEAGAAGLVATDFSVRETSPDDVFWFNGQGINGWYHSKEAPRLPIFSISPRRASKLLALMKNGKVTVHGEIHAKIYDGSIYTVTALIPGESPEEYVLLAHLYEPFVADDALGFAAACELGRLITSRGIKLKKSLRVVFSMELYGFSAYFGSLGTRHKIIGGLNLDSFCHFLCEIVFRRSPICNPFFADWFYRDWYKKHLSGFVWKETCGSLSDDTFPSDPAINIPINWLYMPSGHYHHNSGPFFGADWLIVKEMFPVFAGAVETLLTLDFKADYSVRAVREFRAAAQEILRDKTLSAYEKRIRLDAESFRYSRMLASWEKFSGKSASHAEMENLYKAFSAKLPSGDNDSFSTAEYRAMDLIPERLQSGCPFCLARVPYAERKPVSMLPNLWALFDGKRTLLHCIRLSDAERSHICRRTGDTEIRQFIADLKYLETYGYVRLKHAAIVSRADVKKALDLLGVKKGMKLIVHSTFSSIGHMNGGPEEFCRVLMEKIGPDGVLMMPAFTFDIYEGSRQGKLFDFCNSASTTGILTETFRRMPGVKRSADPGHSWCAWGRDAERYVRDHHKVPTVSELSPSGLLKKEDGFCMTIAAENAVTFMHVVESSFGAPCLGIRTEEYDGILSDGRKVKLRTWGWRKGECPECPAHRTGEIYDELRKLCALREARLGNAHVCLFRLSDYRKVYEKMLKQCGCRNQKIRPRKVAATVRSDWDNVHQKLRKSSAFTKDFPEYTEGSGY